MGRKGVRQLVIVETRAGIDDFQAQGAGRRHDQFQFDPTLLGVQQGVAEQMRQHLFDAVFVAPRRALSGQAMTVQREAQSLALGQGGELGHHALADQRDIERHAGDFYAPGRGRVVVEGRGQDGLQMLDFAQRRIDIGAWRGRAGEMIQALQEAVLDAFQPGLHLALQGLHQRHALGVNGVGGRPGRLAFVGQLHLAMLKAVVVAHMAVEDEAHGHGKRHAAGHQMAEIGIGVQGLRRQDRPDGCQRPKDQQR